MSKPQTLSQRKALLVARADLERLRLEASLKEMRALMRPVALQASGHQWASAARVLSVGMAVYRWIRGWRSGGASTD